MPARLVDEFRAGRRTPLEELQATYAAIDASDSTPSASAPRAGGTAAPSADVSKPFGGVPIGVKELDQVAGWPDTHASVPLQGPGRRATPAMMVQRIRDVGGAVLAGQTTASEFGGVNVTRTVLHGTTHNPWQHGSTPGGSSGGTAAASSGGLVTLGTGGDGGGMHPHSRRFHRAGRAEGHDRAHSARAAGRIRQPDGDHRLPLAVRPRHRSLVRRVQRLRCPRPAELARVSGWEAGLGTHLAALRGARVAVVPDMGQRGGLAGDVGAARGSGCALIADTRHASRRRHRHELPNMGAAWSISGMHRHRSATERTLAGCADDLTPEIRFGAGATPSASTTPRRGPRSNAVASKSTRRWRASSIRSTASTS